MRINAPVSCSTCVCILQLNYNIIAHTVDDVITLLRLNELRTAITLIPLLMRSHKYFLDNAANYQTVHDAPTIYYSVIYFRRMQ